MYVYTFTYTQIYSQSSQPKVDSHQIFLNPNVCKFNNLKFLLFGVFFAVQQMFSCPAARFCLGCRSTQAVSSLRVSYNKTVQLETSPHFSTFQKLHISCLYINNTSWRYMSLIKTTAQKKYITKYLDYLCFYYISNQRSFSLGDKKEPIKTPDVSEKPKIVIRDVSFYQCL